MRLFSRLSWLLGRKPAETRDPLSEVERTEERLWLFALLLIFLLAVGLFLLSAAQDMVSGSFSSSEFVAPLVAVLGNDITTSFLLVMVLLITAYLRERLIARRDENRRLVERLYNANKALERRSHQLATWAELSHALIANVDMPQLLELIVSTAIEVTQAESASVMLLDDERRYLTIASARGLSEEVVGNTRIEMGAGIAGWVAQKGEPLLLTRNNPDSGLQDRLNRAEISSAISVPLRVDAVVVGTLNVSETDRPQEFSQEDLRSLCVFGNQAALALEKAHLYQESQVQLEKMLDLLNELQDTQQQLVHTEKLASVGTLAGGVAHEINNPLMVVLGRTDLLLMREELSEAVKKDLQTMREETCRISDIVRSLLTFSRRSQENIFEQVDVNDIIEKTLALTKHQLKGDNVEVVCDLQPDLPTIEANAGYLQQVFTNLVINAYHAMADGGTLTLRTRQVSESEITIEFEDTGCGIPKENLGKIFDPFFTTKEEGKGTGLGLAVTHSLILRHGGDMGVSSEEGKGTCFTISLPISGAAETAAKFESAKDEAYVKAKPPATESVSAGV